MSEQHNNQKRNHHKPKQDNKQGGGQNRGGNNNNRNNNQRGGSKGARIGQSSQMTTNRGQAIRAQRRTHDMAEKLIDVHNVQEVSESIKAASGQDFEVRERTKKLE